jgi:dTDP-4-amino-4,6-dideoxygalactose transaminase
MSRDQLYESLKRYNVFTRRYFYPLVCDLACYRRIPLTDPLIVARAVAERILALPIYHDLALADIDKICSIIKSIAKVKRIPVFKNIAKVRA